MNALLARSIARQEADLGVPLDYLRSIGDVSGAALLKFAAFAPLAQHRRETPADIWHLARLSATQVQDCGTCVQIVVNQALADGVAPTLLRDALADDPAALDDGQQLALRFGRAVASREEAREATDAVRDWFGESVRVELALAVATAQVFPILKRGLGQDLACALVQVELPPSLG
ncbi:MAG: hypothetical protein AAGK21_12415 [Bacteroidota bacterium]